MSGDDNLPATIPKRARTAVKRPDPIETKNRMKGKMNNINKKPPRASASVERAASLKEKIRSRSFISSGYDSKTWQRSFDF